MNKYKYLIKDSAVFAIGNLGSKINNVFFGTSIYQLFKKFIIWYCIFAFYNSAIDGPFCNCYNI